MESTAFYVMDRGKISGPFTESDLESLSARGTYSSFSRVSADQLNWLRLEDHLRARKERLASPAPLQPPPLAQATGVQPAAGLPALITSELQRPFPIVALLLLHYLTLGLYSFFATIAALGSLPRNRTDDPPTGKALGLCFLPLYNLYWIPTLFPAFARRLNAMSRRYGLAPSLPAPLAYTVAACVVIPIGMATAGLPVLGVLTLAFRENSHLEAWLVFFVLPHFFTVLNYLLVWPIFAAAVQMAINRIFEVQLASLAAARPANADARS